MPGENLMMNVIFLQYLYKQMTLCYHAFGIDVRSLQRYSDAVQKNEKQDDVIEHLVTYDLLTPQPEPKERHNKDKTISSYIRYLFLPENTLSASFPSLHVSM